MTSNYIKLKEDIKIDPLIEIDTNIPVVPVVPEVPVVPVVPVVPEVPKKANLKLKHRYYGCGNYNSYNGYYGGWGNNYGHGWGNNYGYGWGNNWDSGYLYYSKDAKKKIQGSPVIKPKIQDVNGVFTDNDIKTVREQINFLRKIHSVEALVEDKNISKEAQEWANYLMESGSFKHSGNPEFGENLAYFRGYGADSLALIQKSIELWYQEIEKYDFDNPGFSSETGHFTTLVWKDSQKFGIGYAYNKSTDEAYIVLNTYKPGNYTGEFKENVLPPKQIPSPMPVPSPVPSPDFDQEIIEKLQELIGQIYIGSSRRFLIDKIQKLIAKIQKK